MSILSEMARSLKGLIFPPRCLVCNEFLEEGEHCFCTLCRATAPLTGFSRQEHNPLREYLAAHLPIEQATALLYFHHASRWRQLIHNFKYHGRAPGAYEMGRWLGQELKQCDHYADLTAVVPLPLHPLRRLWRSYNQSEWLAEGIAKELGIRVDSHSVVRRRYTSPQALKPGYERAENVADAFTVRRPEQLTGGHLLLVDDVLTTGSTMISCAETMLEEIPDCRLSVAVLSVHQRITGLER